MPVGLSQDFLETLGLNEIDSNLTYMGGQVFIRDARSGLVMVVGIFQKPEEDVQFESIYTACLTIDRETAEDHKELARGVPAGDLLTAPLWRVAGRK